MGARLVSPTFVGRRAMLAAATVAIDRARDGRSSHLLVSGEAGIGKSRFAEAVGDVARERGFRVLRGSCIPLGAGEVPYAPVRQVLRGIARTLDPPAIESVVGPDRGVLARLVPSLGVAAPDSDRDRPLPLVRPRLLEAIAGMLVRLADLAPLLLSVEDVQWADAASLDAISYAVHSIGDAPLSVVMSVRSDEPDPHGRVRPWLAELERLDAVARIDLPPLDASEIRELVAAIRGPDTPPALVEAVAARSDGNPLFVEELLSGADLQAVADDLPSSLRDLVLARLSDLDITTRDLLHAAAVGGGRVDRADLVSVSGLGPGPAWTALSDLVDRGVVTVDRSGLRDQVAFRHALLRDAVASAVPPHALEPLHRRWALVLGGALEPSGQLEPGRWAAIAHHWDAVGDGERTLGAALAAAAEDEKSYAHVAALDQYRRALAWWDRVADPVPIAGFDRVELLTRAATSAWLSDRDDQIPLLREAIAECDRTRDGARGAVLRGSLGWALWTDERPAEARTAFVEGIALSDPDRSCAQSAALLARLAHWQMLEGRFRESRDSAESAIAAARRAGERRTEGQALDTLACDISRLGEADHAVAAIEEALRIALEVGAADDIGRAVGNAVDVYSGAISDARAIEAAQEAIDRCAALGLSESYGRFIWSNLQSLRADRGEWDEHVIRLDAWEAGRIGSAEVTALECVGALAPVAIATGRLALAEALLDRAAVHFSAARRDYPDAVLLAAASADLAFARGRDEAAFEAADAGIRALVPTDDLLPALHLLRLGMRAAADLAAAGRERGATDSVDAACADADRLRATVDAMAEGLPCLDGPLARAAAAERATIEAEAARLAGRPDPAAWRVAAYAWLACDRPVSHAYALMRLAEAALQAGERALATAALRQAAGIAARLGARPLEGEIAALGHRGRIRLTEATDGAADRRRRPIAITPGDAGRPVDADVSGATGPPVPAMHGLTPREIEVLGLLARGRTNRQIASELFISVYTAEVHVSRILGKLGVASRTEAALVAVRERLATPGEEAIEVPGAPEVPGAIEAPWAPEVAEASGATAAETVAATAPGSRAVHAGHGASRAT